MKVVVLLWLFQHGGERRWPRASFMRGRAGSRRVWLVLVEERLLGWLPLIFPAVPTSEAVGRLRYRFGYKPGLTRVRLLLMEWRPHQ